MASLLAFIIENSTFLIVNLFYVNKLESVLYIVFQ